MDLSAVQKVAEAAAQGAGRMIKEAAAQREAGKTLRIEGKGGVDLVTETDQACEKFIIQTIRAAFPDHCFVGEESSFLDAATELTDAPTWVIDPLDGTTNFVHGYPLVCVSIGFCVDRKPVVGVIYNPFLDHMYTAKKGSGAYRNGKRLQCTSAQHIGEALVVNNIGASRDHGFLDKTLCRLRHLLAHDPPLRGLRNSGSACQNMAQVAAGELDAYFEDGYGGPWDVAAGCIIVTEAGGAVHDPLTGRDYQLVMGKGKMLCGNKPLCDDITAILQEADRSFSPGASSSYLGLAVPLAAVCLLGLLASRVLANK